MSSSQQQKTMHMKQIKLFAMGTKQKPFKEEKENTSADMPFC